jgi:hypothetical protein
MNTWGWFRIAAGFVGRINTQSLRRLVVVTVKRIHRDQRHSVPVVAAVKAFAVAKVSATAIEYVFPVPEEVQRP